MHRGNGARIFPVILVLIIIAIAVAALFSAGRALFGGDQSTQSPSDTSRDTMLNTSMGYSTRMTVRGPIVADENFRSYQVTISSDARVVTTYTGYLENPIETKQFPNNIKAYDEFVHALDKANMIKGEAFSSDKDDTRGICATGRVYSFEVMEGVNTVKRLWTSTCKGSPGSLKASTEQLQRLFLEQIPDQKKILDRAGF